MTPTSDIAAKFATAIAAFTPIVGLPTDDDLCNVRMVLLKICLSIDLAGSTPEKVTGLILVDAVYRTTPGAITFLPHLKKTKKGTSRSIGKCTSTISGATLANVPSSTKNQN